MSNTGTEPAQRTTLTGKPLNHENDNLSGVMLGDGGAGFNAGTVGANLLPPGYTDASRVRVPIKLSDIPGYDTHSLDTDSLKKESQKKTGFFRKLSNAFADKSDSKDEIKVVMMSRGDYLKYWAKGEDGKFLPSVQEPPEGRREWVRKQLELNEVMKIDNLLLGKADDSISRPNILADAGAGLSSG
jgi:hypothetical protein